MEQKDFKKIEEKIQKFWNDRDVYKRSVEARKGHKRFVFFEGPPTANGKPGIHHFIGRVFKDVIPRYKTMRGYHVPRKAGWDTHGLPVEIAVEKELGLKNKQQIEKYGIAKFNTKAKHSVWKYKEEWQKFTKRIGFWMDLENPYITYDPKYMESLWWVIQQFDKRKLLYEGHKVLPWCTRCGTALSSHELAQGYSQVTDTSVTWKFRVKESNVTGQLSNVFLLAWTTTPWSTISTMGLSVGPDFAYIKAKVGLPAQAGDEYLILAKDRADAVLGEGKYEIVEEFNGKKLVGLKYEPLIDLKGPYQVYPGDYVEVTEGTGIVTINGSYGEIDMEQAKKFKLPIVMDVDADGKFNNFAGPYVGMKLKDGQAQFITDMQKRDLVFRVDAYEHSYPHCWRCKTPLIYYAKNSWFVAMSKLRAKLLKNNNKVNWVPEHLKDGRFGEFLREVKDWAFSRERYWGTPLPIWKCEKCLSTKVIGSLAELEKHRFKNSNTFMLIRHGASENNALDAKSGTRSYSLKTDKYHLRSEGKAEIEKLSITIKEQGGADMIFSSPFLRTKESAEIIARHLDLKVSVDDRLRETTTNIEYDEQPFVFGEGLDAVQSFDARTGVGETLRDVKTRMYDFVREIDEKHEGKRIVIVSHGHPLWMLAGFFGNFTEAEIISKQSEMYTPQGGMQVFKMMNFPYNNIGELDLHRPYIDEIYLKCEKEGCGSKMKRVIEVADVWFDSGAMPYAQWHYPYENADIFEKNFPADYIAEGIDQTRGWFYTLMAVATALGFKSPYKNVISYSHVLDEKGKKMSKSVGNVVDPWEVIDQYGVDAARWYFFTVNNPGDPKLFSIADVAKAQRGFLGTLMNCLRFYKLYAETGSSHSKSNPNPSGTLDRWILSRLHRLVVFVTAELDSYNPTCASRAIESFVVDDFSNWWIRRSRDRISDPDTLEFLRYIIREVSKISAPFIPFTAEHIYKSVSNRKESVHLEDWLSSKKSYIDEELEKNMTKVREVVTLGFALRKTANLKVRQPLASLSIKSAIPEEFHELLQDEMNVKKILFAPSQKEEVALDTVLTHELIIEGLARELARDIQDMRKEAGYKLSDRVRLSWISSHPDIVETFDRHGKSISEDTLLKQIEKSATLEGKFDVKKDFVIGGGKIMMGIKK